MSVPRELRVPLDQRTSIGDQRSVGIELAEEKRKAVVRKESADTQEQESCQLNDMDVDMDEKEELSFVPSAVSRTAGWHEPKLVCDRQCREDGFQVPRHRVSDGGRRRRGAHDEPLQGLLQCEARRDEGAKGERPPMEESSLWEVIVRQVVGWFGCTWPGCSDPGDLRGRRSCGCFASG